MFSVVAPQGEAAVGPGEGALDGQPDLSKRAAAETPATPHTAPASTGIIATECAGCGSKGRVPVGFAGRAVKCRQCGKLFAVPPSMPDGAAPKTGDGSVPSGAAAGTEAFPEEIGLAPLEEEKPELSPAASDSEWIAVAVVEEPCPATPAFANLDEEEPRQRKKKSPCPGSLRKKKYQELQHISREGWMSLGIGALLAFFIMFFPYLNFIFSPLKTIIHELGHAAAAWLCGFPAVPTLDFTYGGGVTYWNQNRSTLILLCIFLFYTYLFIYFRRNRLSLLVLLISLVCYSLLAFTHLHEIFILVMGHGSELIFSGIFLYRAMSGYAVIVPLERPLYAFAGFFIQFCDIRFAIQLLISPQYRTAYEDAKGGGHWMDFSRLAEEFFHVRLPVVALFFLCGCLLPPLLSFLFLRYQPRILWVCARLLKAQ